MQEERIISILNILSNKQRITAKELAVKYNVSVRTIYRDVDALIKAGIKVEASQGTGGGITLIDEGDIHSKVESIFNKPIVRSGKTYVLKDSNITDMEDNLSSGNYCRIIDRIIPKGRYNEEIIHITCIIDRIMSFRVYEELEGYWEQDDKDDFVINIDVINNEWLYSYICSYGDKIRIIEPTNVREEIKRRYAMAYRRYQ